MDRRKRYSRGPSLRKRVQVAQKTSSSRDNFQIVHEDTSAVSQVTASELSTSDKILQLPQSKDTLGTSAKVQIGSTGSQCSSTQGSTSAPPPSTKLLSPFPADPPAPSIHGISTQHSPLPTILTQSPTNVDLSPLSPRHTEISITTSCNSGVLASEDDISTSPHFSDGISSTSQCTDTLKLYGCNVAKYADTPHTDTSPFTIDVKSPIGLRISPSPIGSGVSHPTSADISVLSTAGSDISTSSPISCHIFTPLHSSSCIPIPSSKRGDISVPSDIDMCTSSESSTYDTAMSVTSDITETSSNKDHHLKTFTIGEDTSTSFKADSDTTPYLTCCNSPTEDPRDTNILFSNDTNVCAPSPEGVYDNDNIPGPSSRETFICAPSSDDTITFASSSEIALTVSTTSQMIGSDVQACSSIHAMTCAPSDMVENESGPPYLNETTTTPSLQDGIAPQTTVLCTHYPNSPMQPDTVSYLSQQSVALHLTSVASEDNPGAILQSSAVHCKPHASQDGDTPRSVSGNISEVSLVEEMFPYPEICDSSEATCVVLSHSQENLKDHPSKTSESNTPSNECARTDVLEGSSDARVSSSSCSCISKSLCSCTVPESSPLNTCAPQSYVYNNGSEPPLLACAVPTSSTGGSVNEGSLDCTSVTQALSKEANLESFSTSDPEPYINVFPAACQTNIPRPVPSTNPIPDSEPTVSVLLQDLNSSSNDIDHPRFSQPQISTSSPLPDSVANPIKVTISEVSIACNSVVETSPVTLSKVTIPYSDKKSHTSLHFTSDEDPFFPTTDIPDTSPKISNSTPSPSHDKKAFASENIKEFSSRKSLISESCLTSALHSDESLLGKSAEEISTISDFDSDDSLASTEVLELSPEKTGVSLISPSTDLTNRLKTLSINSIECEPPSFATDASVFFPTRRKSFLSGTHISVLSSNENNIPVLSLTESDVSKLSPLELNIWESLSLEMDTTTPFEFEDVINVSTSASNTSAYAVGATVPASFQMCIADNHGLCNNTTYETLSTSSSQESLQETSVILSAPKVATPYPFQRLCSTIPNQHSSLESSKSLCHRSINYRMDSPNHKDTSNPQPSSMLSFSKEKSNTSTQSPSLYKICDKLPFLFTSNHHHESTYSLSNEIPNNNHTHDLVPPECTEFRTQTTDCMKKNCEASKKSLKHNKGKHKSHLCRFTKPKVTILNAPITSRVTTKDSVHLHSTKKSLLITRLDSNKTTPKLTPLKDASKILEAIRKGDFTISKPVEKKKCPSKQQRAPKSTVKKTKKASNKSLQAVPSLSTDMQSNSQVSKSMVKTSDPLLEAGSVFSGPKESMPLSPTSDAIAKLGTKEGDKLLSPHSLKHILSVFLQQEKTLKSCTQDVLIESPLKNDSKILSKPIEKKKCPSKRQRAPKSTVKKTKKASNKSLQAVPSLSTDMQSNSQVNKSMVKTSDPLLEAGSVFSGPKESMSLSPTSDATAKLGTKEGDKLLSPHSLKHILSVFLQHKNPPKSCTQDVLIESSAIKTSPTQLPSKSSGKSVLQPPESSDKNNSQVHKSKHKGNESNSIPPKGSLDLKYLKQEEFCLKPVLVFPDIPMLHSRPDQSSKSCNPSRSSIALPSKSVSKRTISNVFSSIHQKLKYSKILQSKHSFHRSLCAKFPPPKHSKLENLRTVSGPKLHRHKRPSSLTSKDSAFKSQYILSSASETNEFKQTILKMDFSTASPHQSLRYETSMTNVLSPLTKSYETSKICHTSKHLSPKTTKPILLREKNDSSTRCTRIYGGSKSLKHKANVPYSHSSKYLEFKNAVLCANKQSFLKNKYSSSIPLPTKSQLFKNLLPDHSVSKTDQHNCIGLKFKLNTNVTAPKKAQELKSTVPLKPSLTDPDECSSLKSKSDPFISTHFQLTRGQRPESKPFVAPALPQKKRKLKSAKPSQSSSFYKKRFLFSKSKPDIALSLPADNQDLIEEPTFSGNNQSASTSPLPECSHVKSTPSKALVSKIPKFNYHKNKHGVSKCLELETESNRFPNCTHASKLPYSQSAQRSDLHIPKSRGHKWWLSRFIKHKASKQKYLSHSQISRPRTQNNSVSRRSKNVQTRRNSRHKLFLSTHLTSGSNDSAVQVHNKTQSLHKETRRKQSQRFRHSLRNTKEGPDYCPRTSIQRHHHSRSPCPQTMQLESDNNNMTERPSVQHVQHRNALLQPNNQSQTEQSSSNARQPPHPFDPEERGINSLGTQNTIIDRVCSVCNSSYKTFDDDLVLYCYMCHAMITKIASCLKASLCARCLQPFIRVQEEKKEKEKEEVCNQCLQEYVMTNWRDTDGHF
ncbi:uncharacterized protein LOC143034384 [Oratosquilla oratoria]|uniref:uncharacterized protein LOC143034384 n=1 Tax=Oratosquilla oratoria TaxID=337810 RepID=UPI003F77297E